MSRNNLHINRLLVALMILGAGTGALAQCDRISNLQINADTLVHCTVPAEISFSSSFNFDSTHVLLQSNYPPANWQAGFSFAYNVADDGCLYYLELGGSLTLWGNNNHLDAWSKFNITTNLPYANSTGLDQFLSPPADIPPSSFNPAHIYEYYYIGDGTGATFSFSDFPYWDNFGLVSFDWYAIPCMSYEWDFGDGLTSSELNPDHIYDNPGTYDVVFTVTDLLSGCSQTTSLVVGVHEPTAVALVAIDESYCISDIPVQLVATPQGGWFEGDGIENGLFNPSLAGPGGPHSLSYFYEDINGCFSSDSISTIVYDLPDVELTGVEDSYCESEDQVQLSGSPAGGEFNGAGVSGQHFDPGIVDLETPLWISYYFTDDNGCANSDSIVVIVHPDPEVEIVGLEQSYCADQEHIAVEGVPNGGQWLSEYPANSQFSPSELLPGINYEFSYFYETEFGCSDIAAQSTTVHEVPVPDLGPDHSVCFPAHFTLHPGEFEEYLWENGETSDQLQTTSPGEYVVYVWDEHGCTHSDTLKIENTCSQPFYVPNTFTPDGDGVNDVFQPVFIDELINDYQLTIVNRWGETMFETNSVNTFWDGGYGSTYVEPGSYVWIIKFLGKDALGPRIFSSSGTVNVLR